MKTFEQFKNWWEFAKEDKNYIPRQEIISGKRIKLIEADEYYDEIPLFKPGIEGTIINTEYVDDDNNTQIIHVLWDNGCKVVLVVDLDKYEIIN